MATRVNSCSVAMVAMAILCRKNKVMHTPVKPHSCPFSSSENAPMKTGEVDKFAVAVATVVRTISVSVATVGIISVSVIFVVFDVAIVICPREEAWQPQFTVDCTVDWVVGEWHSKDRSVKNSGEEIPASPRSAKQRLVTRAWMGVRRLLVRATASTIIPLLSNPIGIWRVIITLHAVVTPGQASMVSYTDTENIQTTKGY